mgnify:FL=1
MLWSSASHPGTCSKLSAAPFSTRGSGAATHKCCGAAHLARALVQKPCTAAARSTPLPSSWSSLAQHILPELLFKIDALCACCGAAGASCRPSPGFLVLFFCLEWAREVSRACASSKESVAPLTQRQLASSRGGSSERPSCSAQPRQGGLAGGAAGGSARSGYSERPGIGGSRTRKRPAPDAESHGSSFSDEGDSSSGSDSDSEKSAAAGSAGKPLKCDIYDLSTGLSEEHSSMTSAARSLGITSQNVGKAMKKGTLIKSKYAVAARGGEVHDAAIAAFNRIKGKRSRETPV